MISKVWAKIKQFFRTAHAISKDKRIPRWLRVLFVVGCIQVPVLPIDEVALVLAVGILLVKHRPLFKEHWLASER